MKFPIQSVISELDNQGVALEDRKFVLSMALARAVGYALELPTKPVDNPYVHYIANHKLEVEKLLCEFNETVVLDIDTANDLISRVWRFRYRLLHDSENSVVRSFFDAVLRAGSQEIPPNVSEIMTRYENSSTLDAVARAITAQIPTKKGG